MLTPSFQFVPTESLRAKVGQVVTEKVFRDRLERKRQGDDDAEKMRARVRAWRPTPTTADGDEEPVCPHLRLLPVRVGSESHNVMLWTSDEDNTLIGAAMEV
jgi:hypothetical protein